VNGERWYLPNRLGTTSVVLNSAGIPVERLLFKPMASSIGSTALDRPGHAEFAGEELDEETGLSFMKAWC
jgi:hypothetical protein